jgi:hypothetical protein
MSITFTSCFYIIKSKFNHEKYIEWMNNFISIVNNFNLVIYSDTNSCKYIKTNNNPNIKIIIKPIESFYNYKYKYFWIENHKKNYRLNQNTCWELNMLWSEKISFVKQTVENKYFDTDFYGWCDIGYFRNRNGEYNDTNISNLLQWPDINKITNIDKNKVIYGCINNNDIYINFLKDIISKKKINNLPLTSIPDNQQSIAGGFFILYRNMVDWWFSTYQSKLELYLFNEYLVKDDQIIIADCVFSNLDKFTLYREHNKNYDNWFMFQRILN